MVIDDTQERRKNTTEMFVTNFDIVRQKGWVESLGCLQASPWK